MCGASAHNIGNEKMCTRGILHVDAVNGKRAEKSNKAKGASFAVWLIHKLYYYYFQKMFQQQRTAQHQPCEKEQEIQTYRSSVPMPGGCGGKIRAQIAHIYVSIIASERQTNDDFSFNIIIIILFASSKSIECNNIEAYLIVCTGT